MSSKYYSLNTICEFVCLIFAIICLSFQKDKTWWLMIFFLALTFITETYARILYFNKYLSNYWLYNLFTFFELTVTHMMFIHLFKIYGKIKYMVTGGYLFLLFCYLTELKINGVFAYVQTTVIIMSVAFVFYGLLFYYEQFRGEDNIRLIFSSDFWWVAAVLFYYFGVTVVNLTEKQLMSVMVGKHHLLHYIYYLLNILLYGFWSYSFICKRWSTNS